MPWLHGRFAAPIGLSRRRHSRCVTDDNAHGPNSCAAADAPPPAGARLGAAGARAGAGGALAGAVAWIGGALTAGLAGAGAGVVRRRAA